ncbi:MAG: hypothetical protein EBR82_39070 [Caulobacteraceae bacterium]|nr:hypothetical protein [Caulobacteraceae bacterium]
MSGEHLTATVPGFEWARLPRPPQRLEGLSRAEIYLLAKDGKIRCKILRKPGNERGIRLINVPSVRAYIDSIPDEVPGGAR